MNTKIHTKYGTATLNSHGYYWVNRNGDRKLLHRIIFEDFYKITLPEDIHIHHVDNNKTNNEIWNLIPLTNEEHARLHHKNKKVSAETRKKISEAQIGGKNNNYGGLRKSHSLAISKARTTTGFLRLTTEKKKASKQGFTWRYKYYDDGNNIRYLRSVDLMKLIQMILSNGFEWRIIDIEKAEETCKCFGYDFEEVKKYAC
jgi:hypothetical protein